MAALPPRHPRRGRERRGHRRLSRLCDDCKGRLTTARCPLPCEGGGASLRPGSGARPGGQLLVGRRRHLAHRPPLERQAGHLRRVGLGALPLARDHEPVDGVAEVVRRRSSSSARPRRAAWAQRHAVLGRRSGVTCTGYRVARVRLLAAGSNSPCLGAGLTGQGGLEWEPEAEVAGVRSRAERRSEGRQRTLSAACADLQPVRPPPGAAVLGFGHDDGLNQRFHVGELRVHVEFRERVGRGHDRRGAAAGRSAHNLACSASRSATAARSRPPRSLARQAVWGTRPESSRCVNARAGRRWSWRSDDLVQHGGHGLAIGVRDHPVERRSVSHHPEIALDVVPIPVSADSIRKDRSVPAELGLPLPEHLDQPERQLRTRGRGLDSLPSIRTTTGETGR